MTDRFQTLDTRRYHGENSFATCKAYHVAVTTRDKQYALRLLCTCGRCSFEGTGCHFDGSLCLFVFLVCDVVVVVEVCLTSHNEQDLSHPLSL